MGFMSDIKDLLLGQHGSDRVELLLSMDRRVAERLDAVAARLGLADRTAVIASSLAVYEVLTGAESEGAQVIVRRPDGSEQVVSLRKVTG